jgi:hypothetical protein
MSSFDTSENDDKEVKIWKKKSKIMIDVNQKKWIMLTKK